MGPEAQTIAAALGAAALNALPYFATGPADIAGVPVQAARLSYVGEAGWEITCKARDAAGIYDALHTQGARPAGLFAQTSMRIEKRFLAYGHDLDTGISPLQAGLAFAVAWETDFIGRDALMKQRESATANRIVTILLDDPAAVPLGNEPVYRGGSLAGKTTSASFGYRIGRPIALADVPLADARQEGALVEIDIGGERVPGRVTLGAAYDPKGTRMRRTARA
jgi:4-methylaminobutanoate oxidase (formaldehyde-forming)